MTTLSVSGAGKRPYSLYLASMPAMRESAGKGLKTQVGKCDEGPG